MTTLYVYMKDGMVTNVTKPEYMNFKVVVVDFDLPNHPSDPFKSVDGDMADVYEPMVMDYKQEPNIKDS